MHFGGPCVWLGCWRGPCPWNVGLVFCCPGLRPSGPGAFVLSSPCLCPSLTANHLVDTSVVGALWDSTGCELFHRYLRLAEARCQGPCRGRRTNCRCDRLFDGHIASPQISSLRLLLASVGWFGAGLDELLWAGVDLRPDQCSQAGCRFYFYHFKQLCMWSQCTAYMSLWLDSLAPCGQGMHCTAPQLQCWCICPLSYNIRVRPTVAGPLWPSTSGVPGTLEATALYRPLFLLSCRPRPAGRGRWP